MSTAPSEAHRKLTEEIAGICDRYFPSRAIPEAAQLLADSEARAVEAALADAATAMGIGNALLKIALSERDKSAQDLAKERERVRVLEEALTRLKNCDWVITPHDRMDAVRAIARAALAATAEKDGA